MKFEDFTIGQSYETATYKMTKEKIQNFAQEFDPQYMHLDEVKANASQFGDIIASGMHTLNVSFRLWIDLGVYGDDIVAGRGMEKLIFRKAVFPGDELSVQVVVTDKKLLKHGQGLVAVKMTTSNQRDEKVLTAYLSAIIKTKEKDNPS